jgi:hypothetical protein
MRALVALVFMLFAGCAVSAAQPLRANARDSLEHPSADAVAQVDKLLPGVVALILSTEANALAHGRPLTTDETAIARSVGVTSPERVRILEESTTPNADEPALAILIRKLGAYNPRQWGLTTRYGIVFKSRPTQFLLAHELRHVAQYERLGLEAFARRYTTELLIVGYANAPLETEANAAAAPYKGLP